MKKLLVIPFVVAVFEIAAQSMPPMPLPRFAETITWEQEKKDKITAFVQARLTKALVIYHDGERVYAYGSTKEPYDIFSARKSMLSLLYGIYIQSGVIDPQATLAQLGIDDKGGLTDKEKEARVIDLLRARSGVYHEAAFETPGMVKNRPPRGQYARDEHWFYNNWDFNALVTIFERKTGKSEFDAFEEHLVKPLALNNYDRNLQKYHFEEVSMHPAARMRLSADDFARIGLMLVQGGKWNGKQIVPEQWIKESTAPYSDIGILGGYGYSWWASREGHHYPFVNMPVGTFSARGTGQQDLIVIPEWNMVIVHLTEVNSPTDPMFKVTDFGHLLKVILQQ